MRPRSILVTGSGGFIGRHLMATCRERYEDAAVVGLDLNLGGDCRMRLPELGSFDLAVHCAALTGGIEGITRFPALIGAMNAQLDGAFFEWALRVRPRRIVYFSSSCVYPLHNQRPGRALSEVDAVIRDYHGQADATYGWVKLTGEVIAGSVRAAGIPVTVIRPFSVYGSDQETSHVVPVFVERAVSDSEALEVWGDGTQTHDFVHVDDCVAAVLTLVDEGVDGPVNIGTGVGTSVDEVANLAMCAAGRERPILHRSDRPVGVPYRVADVTLLQSVYSPQISIADGVARAVRAAQANHQLEDDHG
jgi:nucleoside-diphosphate-sugar epimerase